METSLQLVCNPGFQLVSN